jgi:hypothetical protein
MEKAKNSHIKIKVIFLIFWKRKLCLFKKNNNFSATSPNHMKINNQNIHENKKRISPINQGK